MLKAIIQDFVPCCEQEQSDRETMLFYLDRGDDLLTRENKRMHFTSSAWVMNPERTKVLMVHHNIYNAWSWIGGHADGCGDLFAVAQKELEEETGVSNAVAVGDGPITLEMIGVQSHEKKGKYIAPHIHLNVTYLFEVVEDVAIRVKEDENSGVMWRTIDDVRQDNTEPHMRKLYCKLLDKLEK
ncbi:MAG: NUDIX hydrolase [Firmicutes bacterium]|nr:NUDIX hydrolase [Bacillota bacterium]